MKATFSVYMGLIFEWICVETGYTSPCIPTELKFMRFKLNSNLSMLYLDWLLREYLYCWSHFFGNGLKIENAYIWVWSRLSLPHHTCVHKCIPTVWCNLDLFLWFCFVLFLTSKWALLWSFIFANGILLSHS